MQSNQKFYSKSNFENMVSEVMTTCGIRENKVGSVKKVVADEMKKLYSRYGDKIPTGMEPRKFITVLNNSVVKSVKGVIDNYRRQHSPSSTSTASAKTALSAPRLPPRSAVIGREGESASARMSQYKDSRDRDVPDERMINTARPTSLAEFSYSGGDASIGAPISAPPSADSYISASGEVIPQRLLQHTEQPEDVPRSARGSRDSMSRESMSRDGSSPVVARSSRGSAIDDRYQELLGSRDYAGRNGRSRPPREEINFGDYEDTRKLGYRERMEAKMKDQSQSMDPNTTGGMAGMMGFAGGFAGFDPNMPVGQSWGGDITSMQTNPPVVASDASLSAYNPYLGGNPQMAPERAPPMVPQMSPHMAPQRQPRVVESFGMTPQMVPTTMAQQAMMPPMMNPAMMMPSPEIMNQAIRGQLDPATMLQLMSNPVAMYQLALMQQQQTSPQMAQVVPVAPVAEEVPTKPAKSKTKIKHVDSKQRETVPVDTTEVKQVSQTAKVSEEDDTDVKEKIKILHDKKQELIVEARKFKHERSEFEKNMEAKRKELEAYAEQKQQELEEKQRDLEQLIERLRKERGETDIKIEHESSVASKKNDDKKEVTTHPERKLEAKVETKVTIDDAEDEDEDEPIAKKEEPKEEEATEDDANDEEKTSIPSPPVNAGSITSSELKVQKIVIKSAEVTEPENYHDYMYNFPQELKNVKRLELVQYDIPPITRPINVGDYSVKINNNELKMPRKFIGISDILDEIKELLDDENFELTFDHKINKVIINRVDENNFTINNEGKSIFKLLGFTEDKYSGNERYVSNKPIDINLGTVELIIDDEKFADINLKTPERYLKNYVSDSLKLMSIKFTYNGNPVKMAQHELVFNVFY